MEEGRKENLRKVDVIILCGGLGKRLKSVIGDRPKPLADINGRPFLDIIIKYMAEYGFRRFIFCVGYKGNMIRNYFKGKYASLELKYSHEDKLLGTAGGLKNAEGLISSEVFLVLNGDTFCRVDFEKFIDFHLSKKSDISIVLTRSAETAGFGTVTIDDSGKIIAFEEKKKGLSAGLVNAGRYLMNKNILSLIPPDKAYSMEYDLFPEMANKSFYGYVVDSDLIDIGTPSGYKKAKKVTWS